MAASAAPIMTSGLRSKLGAESGSGSRTGTGTEKMKMKETGPKQEIMPASSLMTRLGPQVDGVNLLEIEAYLKRSKIASER